MKNWIRSLIIGQPWSQGLFERLLYTSLAGMNAMGAGAGPQRSGEARAVAHVLSLSRSGEMPVVFDAGAQGGDYIKAVFAVSPESRIYAFEPALPAFEWLERQKYPSNVSVIRAALGKEETMADLYSAEGVGGVDSLYRLPDTKQNTFTSSGKVPVYTVDAFCERNNIQSIDLLKMDIEGGEFDALKGARRMIQAQSVRCIQFEHSLHATDARYKFRDIFDMLSPSYRIYRILQGGLCEIRESGPLQELPFTVNYLAVLRDTE